MTLSPRIASVFLLLGAEHHVNVAAPYCLSLPRVAAKNCFHEAFVLIDRETEGSLADSSYPRTHRLHHITHGPTASRTSSAPWRVPRNGAGAPRIPEPQARHARERPTTEHVCAGAPWHHERRGAVRIRQSTRYIYIQQFFCSDAKTDGVFLRSLWMNRTGVFTIGQLGNGRHLSDGRTRSCLRS